MFDLNRIVILILICALLYAIYMYQHERLSVDNFVSFFKNIAGNTNKNIEVTKNETVATTKDNTNDKTNKQTKTVNDKNKNKKVVIDPKAIKNKKKEDNTDLISIDNMSQISLGSLLDIDNKKGDKNKKNGRGVYKKATDSNSGESVGTLGSLLDATENDDFFFQ